VEGLVNRTSPSSAADAVWRLVWSRIAPCQPASARVVETALQVAVVCPRVPQTVSGHSCDAR
jgi:hypothetical protein